MRAGLLAVVVLVACAPGRRTLPPPPPGMGLPPPAPPPTGSLWHPEVAGNYLFGDVRARFPGDLLTVVVAEKSAGKKDATTAAKADSSISASVEEFFGIPAAAVKFLPKGFNPESIVKAKTARESKSDGETERNGSLSASITVSVVGVDPSGNLHVQGDKVITVNREEQYIVLTGIVRPEDITTDNSVASTRLADARIDYYGRGVVADKQGVPLVRAYFEAQAPGMLNSVAARGPSGRVGGAIVIAVVTLSTIAMPALGARLKDIAAIEGVRTNQLAGYGLVAGLNGSGDTQQALFTVQSVLNMLRRRGLTLNVNPRQLLIKNVAAVSVTASMSPTGSPHPLVVPS